MIGLHESFTQEQAELLDHIYKRVRQHCEKTHEGVDYKRGMSKALFIINQIKQNGDIL